MASNTNNVINNVVNQARAKYEELMQSDVISVGIKVDSIATRGQAQDNTSVYSMQDKNSKLMTCMLGISVKRGSYIEMQDGSEDLDYKNKGIVTSIPTKTPVDHYFTVLFFNTTVKRTRNDLEYNSDGDIIGNTPNVIEIIPCYVERIGSRERQMDAGIENNSINRIIAHISWDIKKGDILYVDKNRYKITDIEELESDMFSAYMTYYRE